MCIRPLVKHCLILLIIILFFVYLGKELYSHINITGYDPVIIGIILALVVRFYDQCPKCKLGIGLNSYGLVTTTFPRYCNKCGQDLMKCQIESDEEIKKRK
jgi:chromate transport protein ChrA